MALEQRIVVYNHRKYGISMYEQKRELTTLRKEYFANLHSQTTQEVIRDLDKAYKSFFRHYKTDKTARPPRYRGKKYFYTLTYPQASYHLENNEIVLHNPGQRLSIKLADNYPDIPRTKSMKQVEICQYEGNYYACISCEVLPEKQVTSGREIAFDPGSITLLTGYDGENIITVESKTLKKNAKHFDQSLDIVKSKLDRSKPGSKRHRRLVRAKRRILKKRSRRMKQINHCLSKELVQMSYDHYHVGNWEKKTTLGDTGSKKADRQINRVVQNQLPVGILVDYLRYKAELKSANISEKEIISTVNPLDFLINSKFLCCKIM